MSYSIDTVRNAPCVWHANNTQHPTHRPCQIEETRELTRRVRRGNATLTARTAYLLLSRSRWPAVEQATSCPRVTELGDTTVELSTILIKYAFKISIQFWSRRDNSVVPLA